MRARLDAARHAGDGVDRAVACGGTALPEAIRLAETILDGGSVVVALGQFAGFDAAAPALAAIGIGRADR